MVSGAVAARGERPTSSYLRPFGDPVEEQVSLASHVLPIVDST